MKWALFRGLLGSSETGGVGWVGKKPLMRLKMPVCVGGGRLRMDFPGIGIVTAEDEGEHDEEAAMRILRQRSGLMLNENYVRRRMHRAAYSAIEVKLRS